MVKCKLGHFKRSDCRLLEVVRLKSTRKRSIRSRWIVKVSRQLMRTLDNRAAPLTPTSSRPQSRCVRPRSILATIFARNTFRHDRWEFSAFPRRRVCTKPAKDSRSNWWQRETSNNLGPRTIPVVSLPFRPLIASRVPSFVLRTLANPDFSASLYLFTLYRILPQT